LNNGNEMIKQRALILAFLAYEGGDQEFSKKRMDRCLEHYLPWLGHLITVWGPAYYRAKRPFQDDKVDSMVFIVKNLDKPTDFYVAIRGTNPLNLFEWIFQDFWVGSLIAWSQVPFQGIIPPGEPIGDNPAISFGTNIASTILLKKLTDPSSGMDMRTFLEREAQTALTMDQKIAIYLTGHSLGGVLASTTALFLNENWPTSNRKPDIFVFSYAGPTAGNQQFSERFKGILDNRCQRYGNNLDVVTQVWNRASMEKLPILYHPAKIQMPHLLLKVLYDLAIPAIHDKNYTQSGNYQEVRSKVVQPFQSYIAQMVFQHLIPYFAEALRLGQPTGVDQLRRLMESWEIFTTFKNYEPMADFKHQKLEFFLGLLD